MMIETFNRAELATYIQSKTYRNQAAIPISYHRALSQIANPRVGADDVLLIISKNKKEVLGYLGIVPEQFHFSDGSVQKVGAMSCIWVSPQARGQGIAEKLVRKALALYDGQLVGADYVPGIKKIYDRSEGFHTEPYDLSGLRLYVRANLARILPPKKPLFRKIKPLLKLADQLINIIFSFRFLNKKFTIPANVRVETLEELTEVDYQFINHHQSGEVFARDLDAFNWMLEHPWILESPTVDALHQKYYFSSFEKKCRHRLLKIYNKEKDLIAILIFLHRGDHLKLHYGYFQGASIDLVGKTLFSFLVKWKIKTFTSFHAQLNDWMEQQNSPALFTKKIQRNYVIGKKLWPTVEAEETVIQSGDLDAGFT